MTNLSAALWPRGWLSL